MEHEAPPVSGYIPQSEESVQLVNEHKEMEARVLRRLDELGQRDDIDKRWLAIGRTHIEEAFMAINRAVFHAERASLNDE